MRADTIATGITRLLETIPPEAAKVLVDSMLDKLEDMIEESPTQYDDAFLLPLIDYLRSAFDIPDDD